MVQYNSCYKLGKAYTCRGRVCSRISAYIFVGFIKKAEERLEEKKKHRTRVLHIPSIDDDIKVRGISTPEITEINDVDNENDPYASDKYCVYLACVSPNLREVAAQLKEKGEIKDYTEVTEIFEPYEIKEIATHIMELSGITGKARVTEVTEKAIDDLKN